MPLISYRSRLSLLLSPFLLSLAGCGGGSSRELGRVQKIVFSSYTLADERTEKEGIYLMNPDGTGKKPLFPGRQDTDDRFPSFSPDGTRVIFVRTVGTCFPLGCAPPTQIWTANVDGTQAQQLTAFPDGAGSPSFSTDGKQILFTRAYGYEDVSFHVMSTDGTRQVEVMRGIRLGTPSFSPDGTRILFDAYNDDSDEGRAVYSIHADGTGKTLLATNADQASYSRDGKEIVFVGDRGIYRMNADGTEQTRLTNTDDYLRNGYSFGYDSSPYFSPDGQFIVFGSTRHRERIGESISHYLYTMTRDGANQTPVPLRFEYEADRVPQIHDFVYPNCWANVPAP